MKKLSLAFLMMLFTVSIGLAQHTASTSQSGDDNQATIAQDGTDGSNNADVDQTNGDNIANITQKGNNPNDAPLGASGFTNHAILEQSSGSEAIIKQSGRDYVNLEQESGSYAMINQDYGEKQVVRGINDESAYQSGGAELRVRQQGTLELGSSGVRRLGSELRIRQQGGTNGKVTADVKQRDGAFAQINQTNGLSAEHSATIRQDGDSDIYLEQNASFNDITATITQNGDGNLVTGLSGGSSYAHQGNGGGHSLTIDQSSSFDGGLGNTAMVDQQGTGQTATITQDGSGNISSVSQQ